jgi:outer membrane protein TolC
LGGFTRPKPVQEKGFSMLYKLKLVTLAACCAFCVAVSLAIISGCSPQYYKAQADEQVYKIIDTKWQNHFGEKVNYKISDVAPSPNDVKAEAVTSTAISLSDAVAMATASNRDYQNQKESLYLKALDLTLARHQFARQWFGTIDAAYNKGTDITGENFEAVNSDAEIGFNQMLADGGQISTSIALDWARFLTGDPRTSLGSVLSASITQPLLRGAGREVAQENLTQAERDVLYQIRSFNRFRQTFVVSIISDYYRVLQQRDAVTNAEDNYKRVAESKDRLEMEAQAGRRNRYEVDQAEQNVLANKDNYVRAVERYQQQLDEFKIRLALPTDANVELDQNELRALEVSGVSEPDYTVNAAVETALLSRLDLANRADSVDDAARKIMVAANGLEADLNLVGNAAVPSTGRTEFERLQFHKGAYSFGFEADLPLDRLAERNIYRESLIALMQQQRDYDNSIDTVKLEVRQAYRQLLESAEQYQIQKNGVGLADKRVESTSLLLEAGRLTARDLLDSQTALLAAQNGLTAALIDHTIAKLKFFSDIGVLQVRPDGMWEK